MKTSSLRARWTAVVGLVAVVSAALAADSAISPASEVATVGFTVTNMDRALAFYTQVLPFEKVSESEASGPAYERLMGVFGARARVAQLRLGDEAIELTEYLAQAGRPMPVDTRANDLWFQHVAIIVSDMGRAYARLRQHAVPHASSGPQTLPAWNVNAGGIEAFYFRDPDGHFLEVLAFPPDKGLAKWHRPADGRLFLGIDHTAIVVSDTDRALGLYRDALGLKVVGESENHGEEQEHLNSVFGARLRITTLRAPRGPGIELLEYLAPRGGRSAPADLRANDIAHWHTTLVTADPERWPTRSRAAALVSPDVIALPPSMLGFARGLLLRDLDGHGMRLVTR